MSSKNNACEGENLAGNPQSNNTEQLGFLIRNVPQGTIIKLDQILIEVKKIQGKRVILAISAPKHIKVECIAGQGEDE